MSAQWGGQDFEVFLHQNGESYSLKPAFLEPSCVNSWVSLFTLIKEVFPMFLKWMFWKRKWGVNWHFLKKIKLDINVTTRTLLLLKNHSTPHEGFIFVVLSSSESLTNHYVAIWWGQYGTALLQLICIDTFKSSIAIILNISL